MGGGSWVSGEEGTCQELGTEAWYQSPTHYPHTRRVEKLVEDLG